MLNFGIRDDNTNVPTHSHQSHCNCQHHHHSAPPSCCRSSASSHCPSCRAAVCPCHGPTKGSASQGYYWRDYIPGEIPHDVVAGIDQKYVGQVSYYSTLLPVTIYADKNMAVGERAGKKTFTKDMKILCCADPANIYWEHVNYPQVTNEQMKHAVKGGHQDGYDLYIGVAYHEKEWKIGKVVPKENLFSQGLQICSDFGNCIILPEFHILKYKPNTPRRQVRQNFYWRDYIPGEIPHDALKTTDDLCIGQVSHSSGNLPATIYPSNNVAITEKNGKQVIKEDIKILCSPDASKFYWERHPNTSVNFSGFGQPATTPRYHGSLFGATTQQGSNITGMSQNQTTFGTSNQQRSSTSTMAVNPTTNLFGAQPSQITTFGTALNQSGGLFSSQQNQMQTVPSVQQAFSFGIPQVANSEVHSDEDHLKEETIDENKELKSPLGVSSEIGQINETFTFGNLQTSGAVTTLSSTQNKFVLRQVEKVSKRYPNGITIIKRAACFQNAQTQSESAQIHETPAVHSRLQTQENSALFGQLQTQEISAPSIQQETQDTSAIFDQPQTQGISVAFGQPQIQGASAPSSQPETQNSSSNFPQPQIQGSSVPFGPQQAQETSGIFGQQQTQGASVEFGQQQTQGSSVPSGQSQTQGTSALFGRPRANGVSAVFDQQKTQRTSGIFGKSQTQGSFVPFDQPQTHRSSFPFGQPQTKGTPNPFVQPETQSISAGFGQPQTQGSSFAFGNSQTYGTSTLFGQAQPQGSSSLFGQSQTQGFGGSGCFRNNQRSNFITTSQSFPLRETDAIKGGHQDGSDLYIGRAFHEGEWKIGRVVVNISTKTLYVWGRFNETVCFSEFEILKYWSN